MSAQASREEGGFEARAYVAALLALGVWLVGAPALAHTTDVQKALPSVGEYFPLGVTHILEGFDHLLFLTALVLGASRVREVLLTVTAFTVAHSITLALGVLGLVHPNALAVEVLIALSIAYVAFENLLGRTGSKARYAITLAFGLVHGLGFASALGEVGVSEERMLPSLVLFNLGVEAGQLTVLVLLLPAVRWLQRGGARRLATLRGLSAVLVAVGLIWAGERILQGEAVEGGPAAEARPAPVLGSLAHASRAAQSGQGVPGSVYPRSQAKAVAPEVERLCHAFSALPRERRAACAGNAPPLVLTSECTRMLGAALADGAVTFSAPAAEQCIAEQSARYQSCDFMAQGTLAPPDSCSALFTGTRAQGTTCRSSLECTPGLHCKGVSPVETGRCAAPSAAGARCGLAADALASYVPHRDADHPECAGACVRNRCTNAGE